MKIAAPPAEMTSRLRWLAKYLRRLQPEQGRLSRKNAREGVLSQLRGLRSVMDQHFPPIAKPSPVEKLLSTAAPWEKPKRPKVARTPAQVMAVFKQKMARKGYGPISATDLALVVAKAGVRLVDAPKRTQVKVQYAPLWAIVAATAGVSNGNYNIDKVREVKKSVTARRALLAASSLGAP